MVATKDRCLFCLRWDGPFTGEEHIMPEGLGNTLLVLPRGVVCDRCNNGPLSVVDQAFLDFTPIAMMRVTQGVVTKSGGFPKVRFANASVERVDVDNVHMHVGGRKGVTQIPGGFQAELVGRKMTPRYVAQVTRFLFKAALEFTYADLGREVAFHPKFDEVRSIVRGAPFRGYLGLLRTGKPHEKVTFTHWPVLMNGRETVLAFVDAFGVSLGTDLLLREWPVTWDPNVVIVHRFSTLN